MLSRFSVIKSFIFAFLINASILISWIYFLYEFTQKNIDFLNKIENKIYPISILRTENLALLEELNVVFSDIVLIKDEDMIKVIEIKKEEIINKFYSISQLDFFNTSINEEIKIFKDYYNLAYFFAVNFDDKINYDAEFISNLQNLKNETLELFKTKKILANDELSYVINKLSTSSQTFFYNKVVFAIVAIILLLVINYRLYVFLKSKFQIFLFSIKNLTTEEPDFLHKLNISGNDELAHIAKYFNKLVEKFENDYSQLKLLKEKVVKELESEIEDTQREVIYIMGNVVETRSKETGNHINRVAEYSKLLAELMGLSLYDTQLIYQASPMHDIGKVSIPDHILNKPGRHTEEETKIMRTHAIEGYNILAQSEKKIIKFAALIAKEHHEKWDGSGYPLGLKGEDISIFGRIVALADVFDALGSDRAYKKAWDDDRLFEFIKSERGKHFDPTLVDLFFENLDKFLFIREKFKD